ncbi:hypothetical protein UFOVP425_33 [uncultured Caudovirales phage]|uniref:Uncharacterized protein n=1 Tax=uncultured Caudovirales phage TaxID=2100421 RepID=A0A6J5M7K1_9CAUD|nr:hypothetical protein UFOVP425_33 [uncultured Caudovirales phage]
MERKVQIYIEGERLELFNDEKIGINSTVQNIADIAKVFTDFSQSFTVPASPNNNKIFEHFYANEVDGTLNYNIRRDAFIEIDLNSFRTGKIQLEKSEIKNLATDSYTLTFYGDVRSLKDRFSEDKLSQLDYSAYTHPYTGAEVLDRVTDIGMSYDVRYPLISSKRVWQYDEPTTPLDNIDTNTGRIFYDELFPAIKVARVLDVIEATYGVTFSGSWLQTQRFQQLFMLCKNAETFTNLTPTQRINITAESNAGGFDDIYSVANDTATYTYQDTEIGDGEHFMYMDIQSLSAPCTYYIDAYRNGVLAGTFTGTTTQSIYWGNVLNVQGVNETFYFEVRADTTVTIGIQLRSTFSYTVVDPLTGAQSTMTSLQLATCANAVLIGDLNIAQNMPDIKVSDFFSGLLKEFNLTCYPLSPTEFYLEPLEDWYARGVNYDITQYVTTDSIEIARIPLYKKISFSYQKSESFMNNEFLGFFNRSYGDLDNAFNYDGSDYSVQVPFENLLFNKFSGTEIQVGYALKNSPSFEPYVPKPVLLYYNGMIDIAANDFKFDDGNIIYNIGNYALFGSDIVENTINYSLNWGLEVSSFYQTIISNSLYQTYYSNILNNLYDRKNRLTTVKCILPISILTGLKLNDKLIIRDKRYIINEMKTELTTGEVTFTLIYDLRPIVRRRKFRPTITDTQVTVGTNMKNLSVQGDVDISGTDIISATPATFTTDTLITFELPPYGDVVYEIGSEEGDYIVSEDGIDILINEEGDLELLTATINYTMQDGTIETEYIDISRA